MAHARKYHIPFHQAAQDKSYRPSGALDSFRLLDAVLKDIAALPPAEAALRSELHEQVIKAVSQLDRKHRVFLHYAYGLDGQKAQKGEEMARLYKCVPLTVNHKKRRAMQALRTAVWGARRDKSPEVLAERLAGMSERKTILHMDDAQLGGVLTEMGKMDPAAILAGGGLRARIYNAAYDLPSPLLETLFLTCGLDGKGARKRQDARLLLSKSTGEEVSVLKRHALGMLRDIVSGKAAAEAVVAREGPGDHTHHALVPCNILPKENRLRPHDLQAAVSAETLPDPEACILRGQFSAMAAVAVELMPPIHRTVLHARFAHEKELLTIGGELNFSRERIRQLQEEAVGQLRNAVCLGEETNRPLANAARARGYLRSWMG